MLDHNDEIAGTKVSEALEEWQRRKNAGIASERPSVEYKCDVCHDQGWLSNDLPLNDPEFGKLIQCDCQKVITEERISQLTRLSELPGLATAHTLDSFKVYPAVKPAYDAALELAEGTGIEWLTLLGGYDCGKTHLAHAVANHWINRGRMVKFQVAPYLLEELRRAYRKDAPMDHEDRLDSLVRCPLLIIDDLGMEKATDWALEQLDMIVDKRYSEGRPLMVTTNKSMSELPPRIASRLQRAQKSRVLEMGAPEFRLRGER